MEGKDILSLILQGGGTAAGAIAGGPAGAALGASGGQLLSAGIDMLTDKPKQIGPSGQEMSALFYAGETAAEANALSGPSSQEVARLQEASGQTGMQQANELNTAMIGMSPLDRARVTTQLLSKATDTRNKVTSSLEGFVEGSRSKALMNRVTANNSYSAAAEKVRVAQQNAAIMKARTEAAMNEQFGKVMTSMVTAMSNPLLDFNGLAQGKSSPVEKAVTPLLDAAGGGQLDPAMYGGGFNSPDRTMPNGDTLSMGELVPDLSGVPEDLRSLEEPENPYMEELFGYQSKPAVKVSPNEATTGQGNLTPEQRSAKRVEEQTFNAAQTQLDAESKKTRMDYLKRRLAKNPDNYELRNELTALQQEAAYQFDVTAGGLF